jgi:hypothetical protein
MASDSETRNRLHSRANQSRLALGRRRTGGWALHRDTNETAVDCLVAVICLHHIVASRHAF